jgi:hypothetical protein
VARPGSSPSRVGRRCGIVGSTSIRSDPASGGRHPVAHGDPGGDRRLQWATGRGPGRVDGTVRHHATDRAVDTHILAGYPEPAGFVPGVNLVIDAVDLNCVSPVSPDIDVIDFPDVSPVSPVSLDIDVINVPDVVHVPVVSPVVPRRRTAGGQ